MTPTLFMRIHKTAGEALAQQIRERLPAHTVCPDKFEWQIRNLSLAEQKRFSFFQGHISPSALSQSQTSVRVITMVRAPRERLLSCFFYWKEGSKHARTEFFDTIAGMSLLDFLRSEEPIIRRATWNVQARLLAGGQFGGVDSLRQNVFGPWRAESDLAAEAVRALDRFAYVGVSDRYDEALGSVFALLGLGKPPPPLRANVTSARPSSYADLLARPDVAEALSRLTWADQIVYKAACARLDRQQAGAGRSFAFAD